jgi:hypothetical protein
VRVVSNTAAGTIQREQAKVAGGSRRSASFAIRERSTSFLTLDRVPSRQVDFVARVREAESR